MLDERLARLARDHRCGLEPLDDHVAAVCRGLGLDAALAARWRELPDPDDAILDLADLPGWRGAG